MKNRFLCTLLIISAIACSRKEQTNVNTLVLNEDSMPKVHALKYEKIDFPDEYKDSTICINSWYYVYNDSILLILHHNSPDPYYLTVFNMNNWEVIGQYLKRGQGPGEILSLTGTLNGSNLLTHDYTSQQIIQINIDTLLEYGQNYRPIFFQKKGYDIIGNYDLLDESTYLMTNIMYFEARGGIDVDESVPEYFKINNKGDLLTEYKQNPDFFPVNVSAGPIATNIERQRMYMFYQSFPKIRLYDLNQNVLKEILGPEPDDGQFEIDRNNELFYKDRVSHFFTLETATPNTVVCVNRRNNKSELGPAFLDEEINHTTEIWKLDWDGNLLGRYTALGKYVFLVSHSETSNTLYFTSFDENEELTLYKAVLE